MFSQQRAVHMQLVTYTFTKRIFFPVTVTSVYDMCFDNYVVPYAQHQLNEAIIVASPQSHNNGFICHDNKQKNLN